MAEARALWASCGLCKDNRDCHLRNVSLLRPGLFPSPESRRFLTAPRLSRTLECLNPDVFPDTVARSAPVLPRTRCDIAHNRLNLSGTFSSPFLHLR
jgi:hypothetical protein